MREEIGLKEHKPRELVTMWEPLARCLDSHVVDLPPQWHGNREVQGRFRAFLQAAEGSKILRTIPPLSVPRLAIEGGKSVVLIGPNGSGKSTIFDTLMDLRQAGFDGGAYGSFKGVHARESLRISRLNQEEFLEGIGESNVGDVLSFVAKHFKAGFPVDWEDADADYETNIANQDAQVRIDELIGKSSKLFEVDKFLDRKVSELSGGERTKLSLMMVLGSEPDVLLLDEPTNHLDLESIAKLAGLFETYKRIGVGIVSSSHVEWFLDMVGEGTMEILQSEEERELISSSSPHNKFVKRDQRARTMDGKIEWNQEKKLKSEGSSLFKISEHVSIPDSPLKNIIIPTMRVGDIVVFSGKNGTGKTKLMEELVNDKNRIVKKEKGVQVAYMPQFWPEDIAQGNVTDFFNWVRASINPHIEILEASIIENKFLKTVRELGLKSDVTKIMQKPLQNFSGGEQRMLWFIIASLINGTDAIILDEPTNHMDRRTAAFITEAIRSFKGAVILSTHDLRLMAALEENPGDSRIGRGITNVLFEREKDVTTLRVSDESPAAYAGAIIERARASAKRIRV